MSLERSGVAHAQVEAVWVLLGDLEQLAACVPGLTHLEPDDAGLSGRLVLRVGSQQITYVGTIAVEATDPKAHEVSLRLAGSEVRGDGEVSAAVRIGLAADAAGTLISVSAEPAGSGRIASFDPASVQATGDRLLDRFVAALIDRLPAEAVVADAKPAKQPKPAARTESKPTARTASKPAARTESKPTVDAKPATHPEPKPVTESQPVEQPKPSAGRESTWTADEHLATVTSITDAVRSRSASRRGAAASAVALIAALITLWLAHRRRDG